MSEILIDSSTCPLSTSTWDGKAPPLEGFEGPPHNGSTEEYSTVQELCITEVSTTSVEESKSALVVPTVSGGLPLSRESFGFVVTFGLSGELMADHFNLEEKVITFATEHFSPGTPSNIEWPQKAAVSQSTTFTLPIHQNRERASVRLIARESRNGQLNSANKANGKLKPSRKRSSGDDDCTTQIPDKKRKKNVAPVKPADSNISIHLTNVPIDSGFFVPPQIQYCSPGTTHSLQVPFDPAHPGASYPPPLPPYNYYTMSSNMVPRSQLVPDFQAARCMSSRYKSDSFPKCVSCTRRWAGDTCRFQGIRFFLRETNGHIGGISFVDSQIQELPKMDFPDKWNVPLELDKIRQLKMTVARAILPVLKAEQDHLKLAEVIRRPRETEVRATCDTCMTSIFACAWMCRICGREACQDCVEQLRDLTYPGRAMTASGEKKMHPNPTFLSCTRKQEHAFRDFSPVSRFCQEELDTVVREMGILLMEDDSFRESVPGLSDQSHFGTTEDNFRLGSSDPILTTAETSSVRTVPESPDDSSANYPSNGLPTEHPMNNSTTNIVDMPPRVTSRPGDPLDMAGLRSHSYHVFESEISDQQFIELWKTGNTLVVTGLLDKFLIDWTPEYFIQHYEKNQCLILDCNSNENIAITVGQFFKQFGKYEERSKIWKLKDWPPSTDFKTAFPALYEDFMRAVPVPNYTRLDGSLNIASHFPKNTISPDLGPKMYNAFASSDLPPSKGTTRLHLDMADAVNVMLYSTKRPDGGEGMAVWDIFRAEDAEKIRRFLHHHFKDQFANDPIHAQVFYLDAELRKQLYNETGVYSWRIYQRPGDAVFIPAGCAHQVVNYSDCIKVACDFVSPQNVDRCFMLTREFREQNRTLKWKEDVLQVSAMLWFSWLNLTRVEQRQKSREHTDCKQK
ncbi:hypothetical protein Clacol_001950 [Clathrus columnatus]|uniref:JmjC domain-containing protein n=1 Tax=Clathrus columnatus TaxID=1419009 RepID=A0AAV5A411_9AGAM|nr:hypothetical protein Clacol_001950 [Clathrus columnatus]